jgi:hypothetical protein
LELRNVWGETLSETRELGVFQKVSVNISQCPGDSAEKVCIVFDSVDIHETPCRLEVALEAREIKQLSEFLALWHGAAVLDHQFAIASQ